MKKLFAFLLLPLVALGQKSPVLEVQNKNLDVLKQIEVNPAINADSTFSLLSGWTTYPIIKQTGLDYIYYYQDPYYGRVPLNVYIPKNYSTTNKTTCILLLHGAVTKSRFTYVDSVYQNDDIFFEALKKRNYIIIRPIGDPSKGFDWVVNRFGSPGNNGKNLVYRCIDGILSSLKEVLNIDDNKIFAMGHSDGSDGTVGLGVYLPNHFAGLIAYNSMLSNIFSGDFYIKNIINRPLYLVHSDKDDLRPIGVNRMIMDSLKNIDDQLIYKEYNGGYQHYDKHLNKELPFEPLVINSVSRNPFRNRIYWETDNGNLYNRCDWLTVSAISLQSSPADWYHPFNVKVYLENLKASLGYYHSNVSAVAKASFFNNTFLIETSRVTEINLMISPLMVNLEEPVKVIVNGEQVFNERLKADKTFMIGQFRDNFDRDAIWVTSIKIKTN